MKPSSDTLADRLLSAKTFQTLAPMAYDAVGRIEKAAIGSGGASADPVSGDSYASAAAQLPQPNTQPANMSGLPPLQLDPRNGKSFYLEFGADLSGDLPPNLEVSGNGGGMQVCLFKDQKSFAPTWTVNLEDIRNRLGEVDRSRYFVSIRFAVDSIYQVIDTALAPDASLHPTNPNRATLYKAEPVYLCSEQLQQSGERYFVRVPPGQGYLANIDTVAFSRLEELPCQLNFQYPCALNLLPFDRSTYYANSPRIANTRDLTTGQPMVEPFYSNQFIRAFNIRFQVTVDISPNMRPVYSVAQAEDAVAAALSKASTSGASDPYGATSAEKSGSGSAGGGGANQQPGTPFTQGDLEQHLQQIHDHFAEIMGQDNAAAAKYSQTADAIRSAANGVATAASMAIMMSQFAGMGRGAPAAPDPAPEQPVFQPGAGEAGVMPEPEAAVPGMNPEELPEPPNASVLPSNLGAQVDLETANALQAEYEAAGFDPATARDMARLRIEAMRNRVRGVSLGIRAARSTSSAASEMTPERLEFLEQRPLTADHARSLPQRASDLFGRIRGRIAAYRANPPPAAPAIDEQEMQSVVAGEVPWFSESANNVDMPPPISGVDPETSVVLAPAPAVVEERGAIAAAVKKTDTGATATTGSPAMPLTPRVVPVSDEYDGAPGLGPLATRSARASTVGTIRGSSEGSGSIIADLGLRRGSYGADEVSSEGVRTLRAFSDVDEEVSTAAATSRGGSVFASRSPSRARSVAGASRSSTATTVPIADRDTAPSRAVSETAAAPPSAMRIPTDELPISGIADTYSPDPVVSGVPTISRGRYYQNLLQKNTTSVAAESGTPLGLTSLQAREARRTAILTKDLLNIDGPMTANQVEAVVNTHRDLMEIEKEFGGTGIAQYGSKRWQSDFRDLFSAHVRPSVRGKTQLLEAIRQRIRSTLARER